MICENKRKRMGERKEERGERKEKRDKISTRSARTRKKKN